MDPLSIGASVLALITAAGKTSQGLQKAWELRRLDGQVFRIVNEVTGLRTQLQAIHISLERFSCREYPQSVLDCHRTVNDLCLRAKLVLVNVDGILAEITSKKDRATQKYSSHEAKASKRKWLRHNKALLRWTSELSAIIASLTAIANVLRDIASDQRIDSIFTSLNIETAESTVEGRTTIGHNPTSLVSELGIGPPQTIELEDTSIRVIEEPAPNSTQGVSHRSSLESFQSAVWRVLGSASDISRSSSAGSFRTAPSRISSSVSNLTAVTGALASTKCVPFCSCQCHIHTISQTHPYIKLIVGSLIIHGGSSKVHLGRRPCNKVCHRSGLLPLRVLYLAPSWLNSRWLNFYMDAGPYSWGLRLPRVIPRTALVWSIIELGRLSKLQVMFSRRLVSVYDITSSGRSLLNYAAVKGQVDIYKFLILSGADPCFMNCSGIASNQPWVDRALTGIVRDRILSESAQASSNDTFDLSEAFEQQGFDFLHLVVLGLKDLALDVVLKQYLGPRSGIDVQDVNGRTPLVWAAWRGDVASVKLLLSSHANPDKCDIEGYTAIARAAEAGHLDCVRTLLEDGASIHATNDDKYEPLHHASGNPANGLPVVNELLAHGADVQTMCRRGLPLHVAAAQGSLATIKLLLEAGSDINAQNPDGGTPSMVALLRWNEPAFVDLMHAGAKLNVVRKSGQNILHLVIWTGSSSLWETITERSGSDQFAGVDAGALHDGHLLQHCFDHCRDFWFVGTREDRNVEEEKFKRMLDAFGCSDRLQGESPLGLPHRLWRMMSFLLCKAICWLYMLTYMFRVYIIRFY